MVKKKADKVLDSLVDLIISWKAKGGLLKIIALSVALIAYGYIKYLLKKLDAQSSELGMLKEQKKIAYILKKCQDTYQDYENQIHEIEKKLARYNGSIDELEGIYEQKKEEYRRMYSYYQSLYNK